MGGYYGRVTVNSLPIPRPAHFDQVPHHGEPVANS